MKASWRPSYDVERRQPAFITADGPFVGMTSHGTQKYLWGNMPALDVLNHNQNEGANLPKELHLLFAGIFLILKSMSNC